MKPIVIKYLGFTLLEVLVAAFLVGFGLVAMLQLDVYSMRKSNEVAFNSTAMVFALEFSERIRSNIDAGDAYTLAYNDVSQPSIPGQNCRDAFEQAQTACAQSDLIAQEKYQWWTRLRQQIPTATASIDFDLGTGMYTVQITWVEQSDDGDVAGETRREVKTVL